MRGECNKFCLPILSECANILNKGPEECVVYLIRVTLWDCHFTDTVINMTLNNVNEDVCDNEFCYVILVSIESSPGDP
jgi:hypothetical protein